ncbi:MAG TPA: HD domain-containing phosphohydrolase [Kofleriaceae bacterium]|jgi:HD-GYP domain-containing protein (c-di-GMP phosphodiesterase class II)|nr:HD domain-containing phosphohydrolase [Kofleriaceae bacterium]
MVTSPDDLVGAVARDRRMGGYRVRRQGDGWVELEVVAQRSRMPVLLVLAWPEVWTNPEELRPHLVRARSGNYGLILVGSDEALESSHLDAMPGDADLSAMSAPIGMTRLLLTLRGRSDAIVQRMACATIDLELERSRHENEMMIKIGRLLSQERDIKKLLAIILRHACDVTNADAGSIYIVEGHDDDVIKRRLRFEVSQNDSRELPASTPVMAVSATSIVGQCVLSSDRINIPNLYGLEPPGVGNNPWGFVHDRSFDDKNRYQTRSVLAVPMISARNEVIGVIQLINKRAKGWIQLDLPSDFEDGVVPFDEISETYIFALASQAGIALENVLLYGEVKTLFDGFVKAAVTAIESRDPTTSGHSERVARLTVNLAIAVNETDVGHFREVRFSDDDLVQIQYAGLLHDFGKVGVREHVLVKAKKLYEHERALILQRFQLIKRGYKIEGLESKVRYLTESTREQVAAQLAGVDRELAGRVAELDDIIKSVLAANEPTVLDQGGFERIAEIAGMTWRDDDGAAVPFLSENEACCLQIRRGSLTEHERIEINSHVVHSYNFLRRIPWSRTLRDVPDIAGSHHEKLDGTGYPNALRGAQIPIPARMMAISDIYDALTASDRPYKKAMPAEKALDILASDVKRGQLDDDLFSVFVAAQVWTKSSRLV